jgi:hypothetical protein
MTATRLSVILLTSMEPLRLGELIGAVVSRTSTILTAASGWLHVHAGPSNLRARRCV